MIATLLVGCDTNKKDNATIHTDGGWYINTSETITVNSYNKYKLIGSSKTENEDGSITVILEFDKPIK